jgi:pyrimidine-nucleoside phosphorylase
MSTLSYPAALKQLSNWRSLREEDQLSCADAVIDQFDREPLNVDAICSLSVALADSGERWTWPSEITPRIDVPSTGGPGSLSTLLCPYLLASAGCFVPKLSVPGSLAGAIDVLELLPGFKSALTQAEMRSAIQSAGIAHSKNSPELAPADGVLFRQRAAKGRKAVPGLVIASLLSKKLAVGCNHCVVDVRIHQNGNLGKSVSECQTNAQVFLKAASSIGVKATAVLTDLTEARIPCWGRSESLQALLEIFSAKGQQQLQGTLQKHVKSCIMIAAEGLLLAGSCKDQAQAERLSEEALFGGRTLRTFCLHVSSQLRELPMHLDFHASPEFTAVTAPIAGQISRINVSDLARLIQKANADLKSLDSVGVKLLCLPGDEIHVGTSLAVIRTPSGFRSFSETFAKEVESIFEIKTRHKMSEEIQYIIRQDK